MADYHAVTEAVRIAEKQSGLLRSVMAARNAATGEHIRSTDPNRNPRIEDRIAEASRFRLAGAQLAFLAKICRDDLGYSNRHNESNAEMIGRALRREPTP